MSRPEADQWTKAMKDEINQLEHLHTWELVHPPPNSNIINSGYTFHQKCDPQGEIASHKAWFIAKGYGQSYAVDYGETFAPSVKMARLFSATQPEKTGKSTRSI
jgi:hypothetical protein